MIDPDLMDENLASSAIDIAMPDGALPSHELGPRALADARAAALEEVGGRGEMLDAPDAEVRPSPLFKGDYVVDGTCVLQAEETTLWAARLPESFPVYPHGAVQSASGTDASGCAYRNVAFVTPVPGEEVFDYYYTRALQAGFSAERITDGTDNVLYGEKGVGSYKVYVVEWPGDGTLVNLITLGF